ncbi:hypothetical protein BBJ28_00025228, partial [Nothophytophthora sp. Chile5]
MAEEVARSRQYAYQQNSNLVLQADSESRRRPDEPTGEVESLAGKITYRMGDRAQKATPQSGKKRAGDKDGESKQKKKRRGDENNKNESVLFTTTGGLASARSNILRESSAFESASYKPKNPASQDAYEQILGVVAQQLGAQPGEILAGAAEEVLSILKNDAYRDDVKQK